MKKTVSLLLAILLVVGILAGCGNQEQPATPTQAQENAEKSTTPAASKEKKEKTVITWYNVDNEPTKTLEAFNSTHDDIEVVYELVSTDNFFTTLNTRISAGECPDLFAYRTTDNYESLIEMDQILDLTDYDFMQNITDASIEMNTAKDGRVYAFPLAANYLNMFYNKTLLNELGYDAPKNYQEYMEICAAVKEAGVAPLVSGCKDIWQNRYVCVDPLQAVAAKDPQWITDLYAYEAAFTDPVMLDYFNRIEEFVANGYVYDGSLGLTMSEAWQVFASGKAAFQLGASFYVAQAFPEADCEFELGCCPMPVNDEGEEQVVELHANMTVTCVNKQSDHVDATLTFLEWLSEPENYALLCDDWSIIVPVNKNADYSKLSQWAALWSDFGDYKNIARAIEPSTISTEFGQVIQNIIMGVSTGEEAAAELQAAYENKR